MLLSRDLLSTICHARWDASVFIFHTFLCSVPSSRKRQTCHGFGGKCGILFLLGLVVRHFKKDCLPWNRGKLWKLSKCWLPGVLELWPRLTSRCRHPSHRPFISDPLWILKNLELDLFLSPYSDGLCLCPTGPVSLMVLPIGTWLAFVFYFFLICFFSNKSWFSIKPLLSLYYVN